VLAEGTEVFDVDGEKVGEIGDLGVDSQNGAPTCLTMRRGFLNKDEAMVPLDLIHNLGPTGVSLSLRGDELDERLARRKDAAA
jgi:hypothetical protein